ncbi:MAG: ABC transporter ATP-binding protein [Methanomassiliicoccales archaeon]|nr:MAG: ABC transporter ATP-binding protein [Methanomassiliicoccales archaeon]
MIRMENFSFAYGETGRNVLNNIDLEIREGEFVLIVGPSGCGKSTLCRAMNGLIPHFYGGKVSGRVLVEGQDTRRTPPARLAAKIGMVFQDPENQLVMTNVENEMAFGMENLGVPQEEMKERVARYGEYFDLTRLMKRFIPELSGGEKQKLALASVIAMRPKMIVLDEPTSQLDEETASLFLRFLKQINDEQGVGIVLVEHRLERCLQYAKRVVFMRNGTIEMDSTTDKVVPHLKAQGLLADLIRSSNGHKTGDIVLRTRGLSFRYTDVPVLCGLDLEVRKGEVVAIVGLNGCGKSTLLKHLNGLLRPWEGKVEVLGRDISEHTTASLAKDVGFLGQNPNNYLFEDTLEKELEFTLGNLKVDKKEWSGRIEWTLRVLDLEKYKDKFPRDLSCGERERAALASVIVGRPKLLILDEPTRGLDYSMKTKLAAILNELRDEGMTIVLVTHDYRFVAEHATRVMNLKEGRLEPMDLDGVIDLARSRQGVVV